MPLVLRQENADAQQKRRWEQYFENRDAIGGLALQNKEIKMYVELVKY